MDEESINRACSHTLISKQEQKKDPPFLKSIVKTFKSVPVVFMFNFSECVIDTFCFYFLDQMKNIYCHRIDQKTINAFHQVITTPRINIQMTF